MFGPVLLASEGRAFSSACIDRTVMLALAARVDVTVLLIVRIWGSGLGFPNPWLMPSRREWEAGRSRVSEAITALTQHGIAATGEVVASRDAASQIARIAARQASAAVVMAAEPRRTWPWRGLLWSDEPYRVARRVGPVMHLVLN